MAVPKEEILRREAEYQRQADLNPKKRGPKRKAVKLRSASRGGAALLDLKLEHYLSIG